MSPGSSWAPQVRENRFDLRRREISNAGTDVEGEDPSFSETIQGQWLPSLVGDLVMDIYTRDVLAGRL